MGRLMDKDELIKYVYDTYGIGSGQATNKECFDIICHIYEAPIVEAILKADYENRLKADMVAMLTDFLMDIEENTSINSDDSHERNGKRLMRTEIIGMFEQKINSLKENKDG